MELRIPCVGAFLFAQEYQDSMTSSTTVAPFGRLDISKLLPTI